MIVIPVQGLNGEDEDRITRTEIAFNCPRGLRAKLVEVPGANPADTQAMYCSGDGYKGLDRGNPCVRCELSVFNRK